MSVVSTTLVAAMDDAQTKRAVTSASANPNTEVATARFST